MSFTSLQFLVFLAVCFFLYYIIPKKFQWVLLLAASYFFYFQAGSFYPVFLLVTTFSVYGTTLWVEHLQNRAASVEKAMKDAGDGREERKKYRDKMKKKQKMWIVICLIFNLCILAVLKYANFFVDNVNRVVSMAGRTGEISFVNIILPLGISFYMFQSLGYLLDVYWKRAQIQRNPFKYALFVSFFPQLGQGPISRYPELSKTLYAPHFFQWKNIVFGAERILWGFFKKLVIADRIAIAVQTIVSDPHYYDGCFVIVEMFFYAIQLYSDFTGGIDITIGAAQIFGVEITENFCRPFFSKGIKEYWRRWHITMGTWFKDYVFYPFSISKPLRRITSFTKKHFGMQAAKRISVYIATFVLWAATGIWHGAYWRFIAWGVMNGLVIMISQELEPLYERFHKRFPRLTASTLYKGFMVVRTFFLMSSLRLFDNAWGCRDAFIRFGSIFTQWKPSMINRQEFIDLGLQPADYVIVFAGVMLMFFVSMIQRRHPVREWLAEKPFVVRYVVFVGLFVSVVLFGIYGIGFDTSGFIYNQF